MVGVWVITMRVSLCVLFISACVLADNSDDKRSKLPFIADAVGNTLPPPSHVPASVGSPVNLLTPDRYEFYTFDESGELVKRLMTLEEIQAIVAAGEESEGLVTFANDNQPTTAFNFSQPPYTKVHNVVTNVQNVLKAQMEAHKNKPHIQPTLDTPDVSDSWSLILPSIFGNTGVDIIPDKTSGSFTTPETETFEFSHPVAEDEENTLGKIGTHILSSSTLDNEEVNKMPVTEKVISIIKEEMKTSSTTAASTSTTTTQPTSSKLITTVITTIKPATTTTRKSTTTTTRKPTTTTAGKPSTTTTKKPSTTTTRKPTTTSTTTTTTTTSKPLITTTNLPETTTSTSTTTTVIPSTTTKQASTTRNVVTTKPDVTTKKYTISTRSTLKDTESNVSKIKTQTNSDDSPENIDSMEKISTFVPVSTIQYITKRTTQASIESTEAPIVYASTTKRSATTTSKTQSISSTVPPKIKSTILSYKPLTNTFVSSTTPKNQEFERINVTTITTQSVSPSTTMSSTELISSQNSQSHVADTVANGNDNSKIKDDPVLPLFDVAQSISQIASDLGGEYQPIPTTSNLLDVTKVTTTNNMESKDDLEIDITTGVQDITTPSKEDNDTDNFVKIITLDPNEKQTDKGTEFQKEFNINQGIATTEITEKLELTTISSVGTTIDAILSESMEDLLSQVVNEAPQSIIDSNNSDKKSDIGNILVTTEEQIQTTTEENFDTIHTSITNNKVIFTTTEKILSKPTNEVSTEFSSENINKTMVSNKDNQHISNKNDNQNENFVKISESTHKNSTINELKNKIASNNIESNDKIADFLIQGVLNNNNITEVEKQEEMSAQDKTADNNPEHKEKSSLGITTSSPAEHTTDASISIKFEKNTLSHSIINQINSADKFINTHKKDKIPEHVPKPDEFKKKIQKVNIADEELASERNNSWKILPSVSPPKVNEISKDKIKSESHYITDSNENKDIILDFSKENQGLEVTTKDLGDDIAQFTELCNELAFRYWNVMVENIDKKRSFVLSPYSITSMLAMMFMGARGATSGEMNEILKLDDMVTFNPHFTLKNISDSIETSPETGVIVSAFIRELYSDRNKGKILTFYKERAQHFYNGHVEEINFKLISDIIRRRTNLLVKRYTWGRIAEYMKTNNIVMQPPLAAFSTNLFETDCTGTSVEGRDGEMYFVVSPNVRQRRLVPVPAAVYKSGFLAGYDPVLDATAAALGNTNSIISTIFLMPGQQGNVVHADDLEKLEQRLLNNNPTTPTWNRLLRTLLPRVGLELQIPRFSHKSVFNVSSTLKTMGLKDLFDADHADLGGLNGPSKDLYLSDMIQSTNFVTCGEEMIGEQHHIEEYPETPGPVSRRRTSRWANDWDEPRDYQRAFHDPHDVGDAMHLPLHLRPRQARLPTRSAQPARLKFDRPFLYFVRHNPTGMILYVGRHNPRLLP